MKKAFLLIALCLGLWWLVHAPAAHWKGMPAAYDPVQTTKDLPAGFRLGKYSVTPLATYSIKAVVLSRQRYRVDRESEIAPLDLALGWGSMSIAGVINDLSISQSGRWYEYRWSDEPPLDPRTIATHSANTHCIPANAQIRRQLFAIQRHDLVTLTGYLVEVASGDGYHWRSSLTREDTRGGACEVMWVTKVERQKL
jgi:hypothetical protein